MALCTCLSCGRHIDCDPDQLCELCATDLLPPVADLQAGDERMEILQMADEKPLLTRNSYGVMVEVEPTDKPFKSVCEDPNCGCRNKKASAAAAKSPGLTFDDGKSPLALLPKLPLELVADVFGKGASKYAMHNWRAGIQVTRNLSCALRHIFAYNEGEDLDPELGTNHLANAIVRLMFVIETAATHPEMDDRYLGNLRVNPVPNSEPVSTEGPLCLACGQPMQFEYTMPDGVTRHYFCASCKFPRDYPPMRGETAYD